MKRLQVNAFAPHLLSLTTGNISFLSHCVGPHVALYSTQTESFLYYLFAISVMFSNLNSLIRFAIAACIYILSSYTTSKDTYFLANIFSGGCPSIFSYLLVVVIRTTKDRRHLRSIKLKQKSVHRDRRIIDLSVAKFFKKYSLKKFKYLFLSCVLFIIICLVKLYD